MKRSREEHIIEGFPNELVLHHVIGTDIRVMGKLAMTSNETRRWLEEQAGLYFSLFKHNFKNEYCLVHDLLVYGNDVSTVIDQFDGTEDESFPVAFSICPTVLESANLVSIDFIMDCPFTDLLQPVEYPEMWAAEAATDSAYEAFCYPWDVLIYERCEEDKTFALKMSRLFNTVLHPVGYPHASYYMTSQSEVRQLVCRMFRILNAYNLVKTKKGHYTQDVTVLGIREALIEYLQPREHIALSEQLSWSTEERIEAWGESESPAEGYAEALSRSFIRLLDALPMTELPSKQDALCLHRWWQENALPHLLKREAFPAFTTASSECHIQEKATWRDTEREDSLYFDTIDELVYKKRFVSLCLSHKGNKKETSLVKIDRDTVLSLIKKHYDEDKDRSLLEQRCFRLFLYRLLQK